MTKCKHEVRIFWSEEDDSYIAVTDDFKTLSGIGDTYNQALNELLFAIKEALQ